MEHIECKAEIIEILGEVRADAGSKEAHMRAIEKIMIGELVRVFVVASHSNIQVNIFVSIRASVYFL